MDSRSRVANELDRRQFWKDNFLVCRQQGDSITVATKKADEALSAFENKFGTGPAMGC